LALENELGDFDAKYYAMVPTLYEILAAHLEAHQDLYVLVE
jgi:hypothetical protein